MNMNHQKVSNSLSIVSIADFKMMIKGFLENIIMYIYLIINVLKVLRFID